jgi:hypothetical protein
MARPERLELPTLWFLVFRSKIPSRFFGVAYEPKTPFKPSSVVHRLSAIQKSESRREAHSAAKMQPNVQLARA